MPINPDFVINCCFEADWFKEEKQRACASSQYFALTYVICTEYKYGHSIIRRKSRLGKSAKLYIQSLSAQRLRGEAARRRTK